MASVSLVHVTKRYGGVTAVRDLSLHVRDGEFMVLLGPSGCGKTTTLRLIAGLEPVTEGLIEIGDTVVNDLAPGARDVAMVFESAGGLATARDVFWNLAFPLRVRRTRRPELVNRVDAAGRRRGLTAMLRRRLAELSFGHRQEVALGRATVRAARVLLLDQPLSSLDAAARADARRDLRRLQRELRTTAICSTHDQAEAMVLADRVAVLSDGALEQVGTPQAVYEHPASQFVAGFVGGRRMNLLPVVMDGAVARGAAFTVRLPRPVAVERAVLGIRPEHLTEVVPEGAQVIELRADLVEMVGSHQVVHGSVGPDRLTARVRRSFVVFRGDVVRLAVDPGRIHLFDEPTGRAIL